MKLILSVEQANKLLAYLQTKPFREVAALIDMLHKSVVNDPPKKTEEQNEPK